MLIAVQFLTCFPIRLAAPPVGREAGLSLLWYPAVGLLLGLLLWVAAMLLSPLATPLAAALMLAAWVSCTGALHLDGLADTAAGACRRAAPVRAHSLCTRRGNCSRSCAVSVTRRRAAGRHTHGTGGHGCLRPLRRGCHCCHCGGVSPHAESFYSPSGRGDR